MRATCRKAHQNSRRRRRHSAVGAVISVAAKLSSFETHTAGRARVAGESAAGATVTMAATNVADTTSVAYATPTSKGPADRVNIKC